MNNTPCIVPGSQIGVLPPVLSNLVLFYFKVELSSLVQDALRQEAEHMSRQIGIATKRTTPGQLLFVFGRIDCVILW
jgi:hypothetical protein